MINDILVIYYMRNQVQINVHNIIMQLIVQIDITDVCFHRYQRVVTIESLCRNILFCTACVIPKLSEASLLTV